MNNLFSIWQEKFDAFTADKSPENDSAERAAWLEYILAIQGPGPCEPIRRYDDEAVIAALEAAKVDEDADGKVPRMISGPAKEHQTYVR